MASIPDEGSTARYIIPAVLDSLIEAYGRNQGSKFPQPDLALFDGKYFILDGAHRIKVYRKENLEAIQANVWRASTEAEFKILLEKAIDFNSQRRSESMSTLFGMQSFLDSVFKLFNVWLFPERFATMADVPPSGVPFKDRQNLCSFEHLEKKAPAWA